MSDRFRSYRLAAFSAVSCVLLAGAALAKGPRILSPAPGSTVVAGDALTVGWNGDIGQAEEWEAFLSLDGGRSFAIRLTPHLSTSLRAFTWTVPDLFTDDARIRLRAGDDIDEEQWDSPAPFSIRPGMRGRVLEATISDIGRFPQDGERETVAWTEGSRSGTMLRVVMPLSPGGFGPAASPRRVRGSRAYTRSAHTPGDLMPALRHRHRNLMARKVAARNLFARRILNLVSRLNV